ncbi:MAG: TRAM domain-containing protein [Chloroflexi bacterium]|nr:TRAM domain-containing protein [Chloroflexota bacterium]
MGRALVSGTSIHVSREPLIRYIRVLGAALGGLVGLALAGIGDPTRAGGSGLFRDAENAGALIAAWVIAWIVAGFALLPYLTIVPATWLIRRVEDLSTAEFVTAVAGLLIGLLMGLLLGAPLAGLDPPFGTWLPLGVSLFLGLGMVGLTVAKRKDLVMAAEAIGLVRHPDAAGDAATRAGDPHIVVDTSAIIDGRIAEIVESGFIYGTLVVPRFVLDELQHIADSSDTLRRNRGRRGLEILARMQKDPATPVEIAEDEVPSETEVDAKLVALARVRSKVILTNDFNLNRVAELQGVRVMNINSLANSVKPAVLPGEELRVRVIQEGKEAGQGVGFLDDGTMIVVEGGARYLDRDVDVSVTRVLQTVAGRMIFAQPRLD